MLELLFARFVLLPYFVVQELEFEDDFERNLLISNPKILLMQKFSKKLGKVTLLKLMWDFMMDLLFV